MRQAPPVWLLVFAVTAFGAVVTYTRCPSCIDRSRFNKNCEWVGDTAFVIDRQDAAHQKHLIADAQLAEELAIRHADAEHGRRFGVEHHGGLLDNGRFRNECLTRLFSAIEINHAVTSEQISVARGQRDLIFDLAASLLFLPFYWFGAVLSGRWLCRRFSAERNVRLVATGLVSVAVSFLGIQALRLWLAVWEVVRVGNGHMTSIRAASSARWPQHYVGADFATGIFLFWLIALYCCRTQSDDERSADIGGPATIGLR